MFIGHFGVGFGAKKAAPSVSLGLLFIAAQFLDLLWPVLLLLGVEHVAIKPGTANTQPLDFTYYPISHSLLMALVWALLFGLIYWLIRKNRRAAYVLFFCVLSHWLLDLVVHYPDLPLYPGNAPKVGFALWSSIPLTALVEGLIFIIGLLMYLQATRAKNVWGSISLWLLVALLVLTHMSNIFGPPPTDVKVVAWAAQFQWLFVILAFWTDRNRQLKTA